MEEPAISTLPESAPPEVRAVDRLILCVVAGVLIGQIGARDVVREMGANDGSRWATIWALTTHGRYWIDDAPYRTVDKIQVDGRFFSSKPPLLSTLVAGLCVELAAFSNGYLSFEAQPDWVIRTVLVIVNVVPFLYLLERLATWFPVEWGLTVRIFCLLASAFGTYLFSYCVTLNNHLPAAIVGFLAFDRLVTLYHSSAIAWPNALIPGVLAGLAVTFELPAALLALLLTVAVLFLFPSRFSAAWLLGLTAPIAGHFLCNYLSLGTVVPAYALKDAYEFPGSYWYVDEMTGRLTARLSETIDGRYPSWENYLFHLLFGHHGFFSLTPILLIAGIGLVRCLRDEDGFYRFYSVAVVVTSLVVVHFYVFFAGQRNYGGFSNGPRWLFWITPFWLVVLPHGVSELAPTLRRWAMPTTLALSAFSASYALRSPWSRSWLHWALWNSGYVDY